MNLRKLTSQLDTTASWVLEVRAQVATAKHRAPQEKTAAIENILVNIDYVTLKFKLHLINFTKLYKDSDGR